MVGKICETEYTLIETPKCVRRPPGLEPGVNQPSIKPRLLTRRTLEYQLQLNVSLPTRSECGP